MCIGIFSFRAFDRRLVRLAAPISSGVRQGGAESAPPQRGAFGWIPQRGGARVNSRSAAAAGGISDTT